MWAVFSSYMFRFLWRWKLVTWCFKLLIGILFNITGKARWDQMFWSLIINNWSIINQKLLAASWNQHIATKISQIWRRELRATLLFTYSSNLGKKLASSPGFFTLMEHNVGSTVLLLFYTLYARWSSYKLECQNLMKINDWFFFMLKKLCIKWELGKKKSEPQMGFEPTTLRDLVGCSNLWATGRLWGEPGWNVGID